MKRIEVIIFTADLQHTGRRIERLRNTKWMYFGVWGCGGVVVWPKAVGVCS